MGKNNYICIIRILRKWKSYFKIYNMDCANGYSGLSIADYLIGKANSDGKTITNMAVLKMIYFAQGFCYSSLKRQLIKDDFYAWKFGPVEINTYQEFKQYGAGGITRPSGKTEDELKDIKSHPEIIEFLDKIYGLINIHPYVLSDITHEAGGPWDLTPIYKVINKELIKGYFINKLWKR